MDDLKMQRKNNILIRIIRKLLVIFLLPMFLLGLVL